MNRIFKKYEFDSEDLANTRINALGVDEDGNPTHKHAVVRLGYLWITPPVYDENGDVVTEGVQSDKYSVDMLWYRSEILDEEGEVDYPYGWISKEVDYDESWVSQNGAHTFAGWDFGS